MIENPIRNERKCPECGFDGTFATGGKLRCTACGRESSVSANSRFSNLFTRISTFLLVCVATLAGFYASLIYSAAPLSAEEQNGVNLAIELLETKGFNDEVFLLKNLAVFRNNDNWLNASVEKENAYAATNFPFGIVTLYPDFFESTSNTVEQSAILLHEAKHIQGDDEKAAYEYVWKNRKKLGWDGEEFSQTEIWQNVRRQTAEYSPNLFTCTLNVANDCTDRPRLPSDLTR